MPGLSERVFKLPSMVQISAGSSKSICVIINLSFVLFLSFQFIFNLYVSSSFLDVFDLPEYKFFLNPSE